MKKFLSIVFVFALLSCNQQKEYKYVEQIIESDPFWGTSKKEKEAEVIYASSDTMAYIEAYDKYILSQTAQERARRELAKKGLDLGGCSTNTIGFKLYNPDGKNISYISFATQAEQEKAIENKWKKHIDPPSN
jgi:hypothetical protein